VSQVLVTGAAGFIGFHLARALLEKGESVVGLDNLNPYYDVQLKRDRLKLLTDDDRFCFEEIDLADRSSVESLFTSREFDAVVHLAAQAGVRYSLSNPHEYVQSNVVGFLHVLEGCRHGNVRHLVYASSSSVYGANRKLPFSIGDRVDYPVSLYAATKKADELMAHVYSHLYALPTTGLRFFTVYGPWGRPDMAIFKFTRAILADEPIEVYNHGDMRRDFTYIDDVVEAVVRVLDHVPHSPLASASDNTHNGTDNGESPAQSDTSNPAPYALYNVGNHRAVNLMDLIGTLETCLGKQARKIMLPMQPGDVPATYADVDDIMRDIGFRPDTPIETGIAHFVEWYRRYYGV